VSTWDTILASAPINGTARSVIRQPRDAVPQGDIGRQELIDLKERLERKLRLLKVVLRIDTKAKHRNLIYKTKRRMPTYRGAGNTRAVTEYMRIGHEMQRMNRALQDMRSAMSGRRAEQHGWSAQ
jgi:hypothetical protein